MSRGLTRGNDNVIASGEGSVAIGGDVNLLLVPQRRLTSSLALKLLKQFLALDTLEDADYPLGELPAPLPDKLDYNDAPTYKAIFDSHQGDYLTLEKAMRDLPASERVIGKARDLYLRTVGALVRSGEGRSGDEVLDRMHGALFDDMMKEVDSDDSIEAYQEQIDGFCIALLEICVMRCKVLENPNSIGEN